MYTEQELAGFRQAFKDPRETKHSKTWEHGWSKDKTYRKYDVSSTGKDGDKWSNRAVVNNLAQEFGNVMRDTYSKSRWLEEMTFSGSFGSYTMQSERFSPADDGSYKDAGYGWDFNNARSDANGLGEITDIFNKVQAGMVTGLSRESMGVSTAVSDNAFMQAKMEVETRLSGGSEANFAKRGDKLTQLLWLESERFINNYVVGMGINLSSDVTLDGPDYEVADLAKSESKKFTTSYVGFLSAVSPIASNVGIDMSRDNLTQKGMGRLSSGHITSATHEALRRH